MSVRFLNVDRRSFIKGGAVAGLAAAQPHLFAVGKGQKKPNVLLIMSDEHNASVTGCYGNKLVRTPNIDSLAEKGVTFERHYCQSPLCVPSRASFTAGKYCSRVDTWGLTSELPSADIPSIARVMTDAGYESYLCGKMHYDNTRRYGFTEVGGNFNNNYKNGKGHRMTPDEIRHVPMGARWKEFRTGGDGRTVKHDIKVTAGAVDFLQKREAGKPFFLLVGYLAPHFPLIVPEEFYTPYKDKVAMPVIPAGLVEGLPTNYKLQRTAYKETDIPDERVKYGRELYYGLTSWVDNEIGKVLKTLYANTAVAENTVIIYTSDHGENMGEHSMWWKSCMYDQATRVPMVISWPERWKGAQRRAGSSSHLDLVKTIVDIGGGHTPGDWNGDSLISWMDDPNNKWKDFAVVEYYAHSIAHGMVMARSGQWKYTYHGKPAPDMPVEQQLFDIENDPQEFTNLAGKPQYAELMANLHKRLMYEVGEDPNEIEQRAVSQLKRGYERDVQKAG